MYINKINPEYFELFLFAGENSLTIKENKDFDQIPLGVAKIMGELVNVYTGAERYFKSARKKY